MRCCQARRSSISAQYNRPKVRTSTTCAGGIHDSGNRPSTNSVRKSRASARSVLARFLGPRNPAISAGSPTCATTPRRGQLPDHIPPPRTALQRKLRVPTRAVLAQPTPQRLACGRPDLTGVHQAVVVHVIERDLLPVHVKPAYHRHQWDLLKLPKNFF